MSPVMQAHTPLDCLLLGQAVDSASLPPNPYAWRMLRWEADMPLTDPERDALLDSVSKAMGLAGESAACFSPDGDAMTMLVCLTRFPARIHRDTVMWLCAHALMEHASVTLEQEGTMFLGEEFTDPLCWQEHLSPMPEMSDWWSQVSPMDGSAAHAHRNRLQTIIKRRQYNLLGGYVSRALRTEQEPGRACFALSLIHI